MNRQSAALERTNTTDSKHFHAFFQKESTQQQRLLAILLKTVGHFFGNFQRYFLDVSDQRDTRNITYDMATLAFTGILMFLLERDGGQA